MTTVYRSKSDPGLIRIVGADGEEIEARGTPEQVDAYLAELVAEERRATIREVG